MIIPVTFEIYPAHNVIGASRFGSEPCAPPLLFAPDQPVEISPESFTAFLRHGTIVAAAPSVAARAWSARVGCSFSTCPHHAADTVYLSAVATPTELVSPIGLSGWRANQEAKAYGL